MKMVKRADVAPVEDGFLAIDGRISVLTNNCAPYNPVGSRLVCPWTKGMPTMLCARHRTALDLCGLIIILILCVVLILILCFLHPCLFCTENVKKNVSEVKSVCLTPECVQTAASLLSAMDTTADPCNDFFQFACGAWNKRHVIPEDRSSVSTFEVLADQLQIILKGLLEKPRDAEDTKISMEAKFLYQSCVNMSQMVKIGDDPLRAAIQQLGGWPVTFLEEVWTPPPSLEVIVAHIRRKFNTGVLVDLWVGPDDRDSDKHVVQIDQPQLGLPSRDYFLQEESKRNLLAYHEYMTQVSILLGANSSTASESLMEVLKFEQLLANISIDEAERHDTGQWYTKITVEELVEAVPEFNWTLYLDSLMPGRFKKSDKVVCYAMPYLKQLGKIIQTVDKEIIYNYMVWRVVMDLMPFLPPQYQVPRAEFRRVLLGVLADRNRWNKCVEWTNKKMGMAVGSLFVRNHFNHESKAVALEMIHGIRDSFNELLEDNHWMDKETRLVAKDKADSMNERIGYPDYIVNGTALAEEYDNLSLSPKTFLENMFSILQMEARKNLKKLGKPVDKHRWSTAPAVVNAFYSPNKNDIVFPAGILQPLFYSRHFPKSLNYGGIGVVIGHEITHGFDDKGRQFDKHGNLKQWWNNVTIQKFREQAQCIVDQYSGYKLPGIDLFINGRMTQGENIADNGGLKQAYRAYRKWVSIHGEEAELPGLNMTHEQLFFLNYAQIWCGSMRPEDAETKIRSSVHSPGPIRVLGPLSNSIEFSKAYGCDPGTRMNPLHKCSVW